MSKVWVVNVVSKTVGPFVSFTARCPSCGFISKVFTKEEAAVAAAKAHGKEHAECRLSARSK
jgi:hypothetical protein